MGCFFVIGAGDEKMAGTENYAHAKKYIINKYVNEISMC